MKITRCPTCKQKFERSGYYGTCKCGRFRIEKGVITPVKAHQQKEEYATVEEFEELQS